LECEKGKFSSTPSSPNCNLCDKSKGEYADAPQLTTCKICEQGKISTGTDVCSTPSFDPALPVPSNLVIERARASSWNELNITWTSETGYTSFFVTLSNDTDFISGSTVTMTTKSTSLIVSSIGGMDIRSTINYVKIESVGDDATKKSRASPTSAPWKSRGSKSCSLSKQYLDTASLLPTEWECAACPEGAWCQGSVIWEDVRSKSGYWRDTRGSGAGGAGVPRDSLFVQCSDQLGAEQFEPSERSCMGALENHANATEGCNEEAGRLHYCNTTADRGSFTCRLCGTCRLGFAKNTQGSCESCDVDNFSSILASVGLLLLLFIIVFVLIFLKIKTATSGHGAKTKAIHSTIKRIMLSHMQIISMCISLNVPWPKIIVEMMTTFSSASSVSERVNAMGCYFETDVVVNKDAQLLYYSTTLVLLLPIVIVVISWLYWIVLVPYCNFLACGRKKYIFSSHFRSGAGRSKRSSSSPGVRELRSSRNYSESTAMSQSSFHGNIATTGNKDQEDWSGEIELAVVCARDLDGKKIKGGEGEGEGGEGEGHGHEDAPTTTAGSLPKKAAASAPNPTVSTRDVHLFCCVLFLYMLYPSLCRLPFAMFACRGLHLVPSDSPYKLEDWATQKYLRVDMEEECYVGDHAAWVFGVAVPGIVLYTIGLPLAAMFMLYRANRTVQIRRRFGDKKNYRPLYDDKKYVLRYGLLYSGYRLYWWELVISARKVCIIMLASFGFDNTLQLHYTLGVMFVAFALHYMALPFDTSNGEGEVLHGLERNSMLSVFFLLWSATFFLLHRKCDAPQCVFLTVMVVLSNVVVLLVAIRMFVKHFMIRTKISEHLTKAARKVLSQRGSTSGGTNPIHSSGVTNPMLHDDKKKKGGRGKLDVTMLANRSRSKSKGGGGGNGGETKNTTNVQKTEKDEVEMTIMQTAERETKYYVHPKSGKEYYIDAATGDTKWREGEEASLITRESKEEVEYIVDPNTGNEYYIDSITGVAKWREAVPLPRQSRVGEMLEGMASHRVEYLVDPASGKEYYIDELTGDAKWKEGTAFLG
jgi:hypothetical protein